MRHSVLMFVLPIVALMTGLSTEAAELITLDIPGLKDRKRIIIETADRMQASPTEKSYLLAIASIETYAILIDYPPGDNKIGGAYNLSIYKMNKDMIDDINSCYSYRDIHESIAVATEVALLSIRQWGLQRFLTYHRGGKGAFNGTITNNVIEPYRKAIQKIAAAYRANPSQLNAAKTDNNRYTVNVPPI